MHRTLFALALAVMLGLLMATLLGGCEPCYDPAGRTDFPGCTSLTDRWEGVN